VADCFGVSSIVGHVTVQTVRRQWVNGQLDAQLRYIMRLLL